MPLPISPTKLREVILRKLRQAWEKKDDSSPMGGAVRKDELARACRVPMQRINLVLWPLMREGLVDQLTQSFVRLSKTASETTKN